MLRSILPFSLVALALCGVVHAAELDEGAKELGFAASWSDADSSGSTIFVEGRLGFMLTPNHEVGPIATYFSFNADTDDDLLDELLDNDEGTVGGFYRYNFATASESTVPFAGASAQLPFGDLGDVVDYLAGVEIGLRVMPSDTASINLTGFYNRQFGADDFDDFDNWGAMAGISIFFGGGS